MTKMNMLVVNFASLTVMPFFISLPFVLVYFAYYIILILTPSIRSLKISLLLFHRISHKIYILILEIQRTLVSKVWSH